VRRRIGHGWTHGAIRRVFPKCGIPPALHYMPKCLTRERAGPLVTNWSCVTKTNASHMAEEEGGEIFS
jgi:hypothetical protein